MSALDLILRNGTLVTPEGLQQSNVGVIEGRIVSLAGGTAREEIKATGLHIFPGVIDSHVHFNEPGRAEWEGIKTGSRAIAAGGGTVFFDMPLNAHPPTCDAESFDLKLAAAQKQSVVDFALWGGIVPGNLDKLEELAARGVIGFKAFMSNSGIGDFPCIDDSVLKEGMKRAAKLKSLVAVHAESDSLTGRLAREKIALGKTSVRDYLESRPVAAELDAIRRATEFAGETGCALHVVHVSTGEGVALVVAARKAGVDISCETCPHYLVLTETDMERLGAVAKCAPPLRPAHIQENLWQHVLAGDVLTIGSDHSPSPPEMKTDRNFFKVWGGISGAQHTLPLLITELGSCVLPLPMTKEWGEGRGEGQFRKCSSSPQPSPPLHGEGEGAGAVLQLLTDLLSANVARRFQIPHKGKIAIGFDADLALVDLNQAFTVAKEDLFYRHPQSPYVGRTLTGRVVQTILRGKTVFRDGKFVSPPAGTLVKPQR